MDKSIINKFEIEGGASYAPIEAEWNGISVGNIKIGHVFQLKEPEFAEISLHATVYRDTDSNFGLAAKFGKKVNTWKTELYARGYALRTHLEINQLGLGVAGGVTIGSGLTNWLEIEGQAEVEKNFLPNNSGYYGLTLSIGPLFSLPETGFKLGLSTGHVFDFSVREYLPILTGIIKWEWEASD